MNNSALKQKPSNKFFLEYTVMIAGFIILITSVGLLVKENNDMVNMEMNTATSYDMIDSLDSIIIKVGYTGNLARHYVRSQNIQDLERFKESFRNVEYLIVSTNDKIKNLNNNVMIKEIAVDLEEMLSDIYQLSYSMYNNVLSFIVTESTTTQAAQHTRLEHAIDELENNLYELYRLKLSVKDRLINVRVSLKDKKVAQSNMVSVLGIIISVFFFILSFVLLRNKINIINKYSLQLEQETQRALRAEQVKSYFLANMSHEIRTPMTAILGFSELLSDKIQDPQYKAYIEGIQTSGKALLALINDILDLSKIEAGHMNVNEDTVYVTSLINTIHIIFSQITKNKGLEFTVELAAYVPDQIITDENRLRQILINLIGNAIKFTSHGFVKLTITRHYNEVDGVDQIWFSVSDTGIGISKEQQKYIFDPFYQVDGGKSRIYGGAGLGLPLSLRLANLLGGTITCESDIEQGATFTLIIPLKEVPLTDKDLYCCQDLQDLNKKDTNTIHITGGTVLIVEDDTYNRTLLREFLGKESVTVFTANNGIEALNILDHKHIDVVITDIMMPKMSGIELIRTIKSSEKLRHIPIIVASASSLLETYQDSPDIASYLKKPFRRLEFIELLSNYLPHETVPCILQECNDENNEVQVLTDFSWDKIDIAIRKGIKKSYENKFKMLRVTLSIEEIFTFGNELMTEGKQQHCEPIIKFGQALRNAAENVDIVTINRLFTEFDKLFNMDK